MSRESNSAQNSAQQLAQLHTMAEMQDGYNQTLHVEWRQQGFQFYRAIWIECGEALDHFGWKWWKHTEPDLDQVKLELVDIWHFGLSDLMRAGQEPQQWQAAFQTTQPQAREPEQVRLALETFASATLQQQGFDLAKFVELLYALPMNQDELFDLYVGKNVLNGFRQDNGYRTGEYRKLWGGREDNEHLIDALNDLACPPQALPQVLYAELQRRYDASVSV